MLSRHPAYWLVSTIALFLLASTASAEMVCTSYGGRSDCYVVSGGGGGGTFGGSLYYGMGGDRGYWPGLYGPANGNGGLSGGNGGRFTPGGPFVTPLTNPEVARAYHKSMTARLFDPGAPATRDSYQALSQALDKYGTAEKAVAGITAEQHSAMREQVEIFQKSSPQDLQALSPLQRSFAIAGIPVPQIKELDSLREAVLEQDPFKLAAAIDRLMEQAANGHRPNRQLWKEAFNGTLTNGDWLMFASGDAPSLVKFKTSWLSTEGRDIRSSYNRTKAAQMILSAAIRGTCAESPDKCEALTSTFDELRDNYSMLSLGHAIADKMATDPTLKNAYAEIMGFLRNQADFYKGIINGAVEANAKLGEAMYQMAIHPIDTLSALSNTGVVLCEAMIHLDRLAMDSKETISQKGQKFLQGSATVQGEMVGAFAYEIAGFFLPGGAQAKGVQKAIIPVAERTLVQAGVRATIQRAPAVLPEVAAEGATKLARLFPAATAELLGDLPQLTAALEKVALKEIDLKTVAKLGRHDLAVKKFMSEAPEVFLKSLDEIGVETVSAGSTGLLKLEAAAPEFTKHIIKAGSRNTEFYFGKNFVNSSPDFIEKFAQFAKAEKLTQGKVAAISDFIDGASHFMTKEDYIKYVVGNGVLGRPDGLYVTTKRAADAIVKNAGDSALEFSKIVSKEANWVKGKVMVQIDIPFDLKYRPRMPVGWEKSANEFFTYGGTTQGGLTEIVVDQYPASRILRVIEVNGGKPLK
jgi:hypothetical protein